MELGPAWAEWAAATADGLRERELLRELRTVSAHKGSSVVVSAVEPWAEGCADPLQVFSSNDYLGLSVHPAVRKATAAAAAAHGCGPRSSALIGGHTVLHQQLEASLAALKGTEAALVFPTGYAANTAVLGALADSGSCTIFSDELNHASIIDGARLAARGTRATRGLGATLQVFRHRDLDHLSRLLVACPSPRKLIVSDSLFSMDGDVADVAGLAQLRDDHGALLVLDEAHATLVYGESGGGVAEAAGVGERVDVHVGTLSKAFGAHGGFAATSEPLKQLLISRGRAGIFSTALPAPALAAASAALREATPQLRARLWSNVEALRDETGAEASSPIVPIVVGDAGEALAASRALLRDGFHVPAIRPPTVPHSVQLVPPNLTQ